MFAPRFSPWLRLLWFGLGAAVSSSAFQVVIVAALTFAAMMSGQNPDALREEGIARYALWITVLSYPPIWLWLMFCRRHFDRRSVRSLGFRLESWARSLGGGILAGTLAISWLFGALWLCGSVRFGGISPDAFDRAPAIIAGYLLLYAALFACVGFMEEAIFRGYVLHNLSASIGLRGAIWLQSFAFAAIHLGNAAIQAAQTTDETIVRSIWMDAWRGMPSIALIGAIFALCWAKTGSLWFPIGFHAAWNFCLGCIFSLPVSGLPTFRLFDITPVGNAWLNGGSFGAEGSILLWPILGILLWSLRRVPDHPQIHLDLALLDPNQKFETIPVAPLFAATETEENEDETPRESRFKTSMRGREVQDSDAPVPLLGQLPRAEEAVPVWPASAISNVENINQSPQNAPQTPRASDAEWRFQPLEIPARPTIPEVVVEVKPPTPTIEAEVASETVQEPDLPTAVENEKAPAPVEKPRPPAPRW